MTTEEPLTLSVRNNHGRCLLCGDRNPWSLRLSFQPDGEGTVETRFTGHGGLQGYDGMLHGGVIAALLDAAMTHCLFHQGIQAVTGDLHVRYLHAVPCDADLEIRSRVTASHPPLYRLEAQILVGGRVAAWSEAKFVRRRKRPGKADRG
ncbi:MAG: PaaI family thioesterase [Acidobacteria bacterium]|nr:PaaI family thioesterase [Acidobacteriota bacterium]